MEFHLNLIQKYSNEVDVSILKQYSPADEYQEINTNEPELKGFKIKLPTEPEIDYNLITNFGLPAKDQYFQLEKMPKRLRNLIEKTHLYIKSAKRSSKEDEDGVSVDEIFNYLQKNSDSYRNEIKWIENMWYYMINGKWIFINGKLTYLDGWFWFYLNFYTLDTDTGRADYRDRDRRWFNFARYCYKTTEAFFPYRVRYEKNGRRSFEYFSYRDDAQEFAEQMESIVEEGGYIVDMGKRTCYGFTYPKHRRDGATHKTLAIMYSLAITHRRKVFGIQSMNGDSAEVQFKDKLVPAWKAMPFFFKPRYNGKANPASKINFQKKGSTGSGANYNPTDELNTNMSFADTAKAKYDGEKLMMALLDEEGKTTEVDIDARWDDLKPCFSQGDGAVINGFSIHPSTVSDMKQEGGENFFNLTDRSHWQFRDSKSGETSSGLFNFFIKAEDGMEGFIGPYGESIIGDPTEEQAKFIGKNYGAREAIENKRKMYLAKGDPKSMAKYEKHLSLFPQNWADCFRVSEGDTGFNRDKLLKAKNRLRRDKNAVVRCDLEWENGIVKRIVNETDGAFEFSYLPDPKQTNQKFIRDGVYYPLNPRFVSSADPFKFLADKDAKRRDDKSRLSKGGGTTFWPRDKSIDPDTKDINEWSTHRFIVTYMRRVGQDDYAEDMLKMCVYLGSRMYPENNVDLIYKHFWKRGYAGYLMYDIDPITKKMKDKPGYFATNPVKQKMFSLYEKYIDNHIHREKHLAIVNELLNIKGIEYMTKHDLFAAGGGNLLALENDYEEFDNLMNEEVDLEDLYEF